MSVDNLKKMAEKTELSYLAELGQDQLEKEMWQACIESPEFRIAITSTAARVIAHSNDIKTSLTVFGQNVAFCKKKMTKQGGHDAG